MWHGRFDRDREPAIDYGLGGSAPMVPMVSYIKRCCVYMIEGRRLREK